jgi:hypothetical protein
LRQAQKPSSFFCAWWRGRTGSLVIRRYYANGQVCRLNYWA